MKVLLDQIMYERNLTVRKVSIMTGVPKSTISDIVSGRTSPRLNTLEQLAAGLKVHMTDLFESTYKQCPRSRTIPCISNSSQHSDCLYIQKQIIKKIKTNKCSIKYFLSIPNSGNMDSRNFGRAFVWERRVRAWKSLKKKLQN